MQITSYFFIAILLVAFVEAGDRPIYGEDPYLQTPGVIQWLDEANKFWDVRVVDVDLHMPHDPPIVGTIDMDIFPPDNETWNVATFVAFVEFDRDLNVRKFKDSCHPLSYPIHGTHQRNFRGKPIIKRGFTIHSDNVKRLGFTMVPHVLEGNRVFIYAGLVEFFDGHTERDVIVQYVVACEDDNLENVVADAMVTYTIPTPTEYDFKYQTFFNITLEMASPPALALAFRSASQRDPTSRSMTELEQNKNLLLQQQLKQEAVKQQEKLYPREQGAKTDAKTKDDADERIFL